MRNYLYISLFLPLFQMTAQWDESPHPDLAWYTIETENFYVHYHDGAERSAQLAAKIAEEIYPAITHFYRYEPKNKTHIVVRDHGDYSGGAAFFYDDKIEVWANALDFDLRGTSNWLRNVITHEFTHIVQLQSSFKFGGRIPAFYIQWLGYEDERRPDVLYGFPNVLVSYPISGFVVPPWFAEGTAQYMHPSIDYDRWDSHRDMLLRMYILEGDMLTWNEMSVFGKTSLGNESAYNAGFSLVKYIAQEYGPDALRKISRELSSLSLFSIDQAIRRVIGISGQQLYKQWITEITSHYRDNTKELRDNLTEEVLIENEGFGNFHPSISPDGKYIAYVSNKGFDYLGKSSLYLYNLETGEKKRIAPNVRSRISWSPDGSLLYFSRITRKNPHRIGLSDLFLVDIESGKAERLTNALRLHDPDVSPDGNYLAAVTGADGTQNLVIYNLNDDNLEYITLHGNGEQVYGPRWSPDGKKIVFATSRQFNRTIKEYSVTDYSIDTVIKGDFDTRDPVYSPDGKFIYFASDSTGIFNIYRVNRRNGKIEQLTNMLGGAFMPAVGPDNNLVYASYQSDGYKIALSGDIDKNDGTLHYVYNSPFEKKIVGVGNPVINEKATWEDIRKYDDTNISERRSDNYSRTFTNTMIVPLIRFDNYIRGRDFIDMLKPGFYLATREILERHSFFAGAAINRKLERDLFVIFEWNDKLPPFSFFGWYPSISFEIYNISRKAESEVSFHGRPDLLIDVDVTYNLTEFNAIFRDYIISPVNRLEIFYRHSRYSYKVGTFLLPEREPPLLIQASGESYLIGNMISASLKHRGLLQSIRSDINPRGRLIHLKYSLEMNKFNPELTYNEDSNELFLQYENQNFHRLEGLWREHLSIYGEHTVTGEIRKGSLLGKDIDEFFNFYIGGLMGLRGYPFYSLGGNDYFKGSLTYRFPIWDGRSARILHLHLERIYGSLFTSAGDAWTGSFPGFNSMKRDAGFEIRMEMFSFYVYPTRLFFSAAYGFDRFTREFRGEPVTYGKQWNFYFGVLFGFDLGTLWSAR